jgi:two-component system, LytTR family, response regulator
MKRTTTLIAEDEPLASEGLADWVRQLPELELVGVRADGPGTLHAMRELAPELVLMDIHMPGMNGLQVLRALAGDPGHPPPTVIFTTAYDEHAVAAFELHAVDYLLKPFSQERFVEAVRHALQSVGARDAALPALAAAAQADIEPLTRVLVRDGGKIFPVMVDAITCLRSDTKYTAIVSQGRSHLVRLPLSAFEKRLDPGRFLKINRACIVNLDFVVAMVPGENSQLEVQLKDGTRVTASREVSRQLRADSL